MTSLELGLAVEPPAGHPHRVGCLSLLYGVQQLATQSQITKESAWKPPCLVFVEAHTAGKKCKHVLFILLQSFMGS